MRSIDLEKLEIFVDLLNLFKSFLLFASSYLDNFAHHLTK